MVTAAQHLHYSPGRIVRSEEAELDTEERRARAEARRRKAAAMGDRLRILRAVRGYTQRRLSELTGLSRQYLSEVEQGKRPRPRRETLEGLATALEVTVEELKGTVPLGVPPPPAGEGGAGSAPSAHGAFALTGTVPEALETINAVAKLLAGLSPGVVVMQHHYPDGSVLLYIRLPPGTAKPPQPPG